MSWSITLIGKPEKISEALKAESERLADMSKEEFDAVLPHIQGIVNQNIGLMETANIKVTASGHGYAVDGEVKNRQCLVSVEFVYGKLV